MSMVLMALAATALYGTQSVVIRTWLTGYTAPVLLVCFYLTGLAISGGLLFHQMSKGHEVVFPSGAILICTILAGAAYCIADYYMIGALRLATSVSVTSILLLTPVFAGVGTFVLASLGLGIETSLLPNRYEVLTFVLVIATLATFQKSQEVRNASNEQPPAAASVG